MADQTDKPQAPQTPKVSGDTPGAQVAPPVAPIDESARDTDHVPDYFAARFDPANPPSEDPGPVTGR